MRIATDHASHATSLEVADRIRLGQTFTPGCAAAVASWYQSPGGHGAVFASLASGLPVESADLRAAILAELAIAARGQDPAQIPELLGLAIWADVKTR